MSDRPLKDPAISAHEHPIAEPVRTPEFTDAADKALQEGFGAIDLQKLQQLIDEGVIPETVMGLYQEMHDPSAGTPLLDVYRTASPERQQKILHALERTAQKMEKAAEASSDKFTMNRLIQLVSLLYLALLYRNTTQLTGDKALDPGKNNEGAVLRILEHGGAEVFSHPEQFEITNLLQFCTDLIDQGHGPAVLHHIELIPAAYHSHLILRCLQASRQKEGTGEALYIVESLSRTKELDLDVAQQLCRLKLDAAVIDHLERFQATKLEEITKLLLKNERVAFAEVFKRILALPQQALGEHVIVAACFAKSAYVARLLEDSDQDLQEVLHQRLPDLKEQLGYIREVNAGHKTVTYHLKYIPTAKLADKIGKSFHGGHPLSLPNVKFLRDDVARALVKYTHEYVELRGLTEITDTVAELLSNSNVKQLNLEGVEGMSLRAQHLFSERRGWFVAPTGLLVQSDKAAVELVKGEKELHLEMLEIMYPASAVLICDNHGKGRVYLDGLKELEYYTMKTFQVDGRRFPVSLNGCVFEDETTAQPAFMQLVVRNYQSHPPKLSPTCLRLLRTYHNLKLAFTEGITLPGVSRLTAEEMTEIVQFKGPVLLDGLVDLPVEQATILGTHTNGSVRLGGITELSYEVAVALSPLPDGLSLPLVRGCDAKTLEVLCGMKGSLALNAFHTLTLAEASMLATHQGSLTLNGITTLAAGTLSALLAHEGPLCLKGLPEHCPHSLETLLYQKRGWLPGTEARSDVEAEIEAIRADLAEVTELSTPFAKMLVKHRQGMIALDSVRTMRDEQLEVLGTFTFGDLSLKGLVRLSVNGARALSRFKASIFFNPDIEMDEEARLVMAPYFAHFRTLFGGKDLPAVAVEALVEQADAFGEREYVVDTDTVSKYHSFLTLESLSVATAKVLARTKTPIILGVSSMTEEVAQCFEQYTGVLSLPKLKKPSLGVIESLGAMTGLLILPGITHLTEDEARALAKHKGRIALPGITLTDLDRDVRRVILKYPERILLKDIGKGGSLDKEVQKYLK